MNTINLNRAGKEPIILTFPENWSDLTKEETIAVKKLLKLHKNKDVAKAQIIVYLIETRSAKEGKKLPSNWRAMLNYEEAVLSVFPTIEFLFQPYLSK